MKVLLVDDNATFLMGLRNLLEAAGFQVVGCARNAESALAKIRFLLPDVVLMDVQMPGHSGIEATATIKKFYPSIRIVMMTVSEKEEHLFESIRAGASGFLLKSMAMEDFPDALEQLARGDTPLSAGLIPKIFAEFARVSQAKESSHAARQAFDNQLSMRQKNILQLTAFGKTYKDIAQEIGVSERTIKYEVRNIADALRLENRAQVLAYASRYLTSPPEAS